MTGPGRIGVPPWMHGAPPGSLVRSGTRTGQMSQMSEGGQSEPKVDPGVERGGQGISGMPIRPKERKGEDPVRGRSRTGPRNRTQYRVLLFELMTRVNEMEPSRDRSMPWMGKR